VLSMRVEFKRLAMRIENGEEPDQARQTLKELVHATLDRDASADDTDLLCETFRGIEPVAAQEIVAVGMERLTVLLSQMLGAENQAGLDSLGKTTDLMLRVLDSASMAPTAATAEHSVLAARHGLLDLISVALQAIERQLTSDDEEPLLEGVVTPKPEDLFAIVLKLLKFTLGLLVAEPSMPAQPRPDFGRLASSFFRVIVAVSDKCNVQTIESLVTVLVYIVDSAPSASRASVHAALMAEMSSASSLSALHHRPVIVSALPYTSPPRRPVVLSNPNMGEGADSHLPLDDRPWEMFEALDPPANKVKHGEMFLATKPLRDTASIPMSLFGPQMKREVVPCMPDPGTDRREGVDGTDSDEGDGTTWDDYASERNLGDGQAGEPLVVRQLATSLYANPEESTAEDDAATVRSALSPVQPSSATLAFPSSPAVSSTSTAAAAPAPASAAGRPRRASTRLTAPSAQAVRAQTGSNRDPITFEDSEDDEPESESESEPEPLEMPVGKRPRRGGKTVGGKTTRKTTGGKGVPRKVVGGKGVRSVSGKPVRGGRRRSIAD
jgi:mediator of RNA polymerase II transcription subunit 12